MWMVLMTPEQLDLHVLHRVREHCQCVSGEPLQKTECFREVTFPK